MGLLILFLIENLVWFKKNLQIKKKRRKKGRKFKFAKKFHSR